MKQNYVPQSFNLPTSDNEGLLHFKGYIDATVNVYHGICSAPYFQLPIALKIAKACGLKLCKNGTITYGRQAAKPERITVDGERVTVYNMSFGFTWGLD